MQIQGIVEHNLMIKKQLVKQSENYSYLVRFSIYRNSGLHI